MKRFNEKEVVYTITAEMDNLEVWGNALVSGDEVADKECEDEILRRLENGDVWAWASVEVKASWNGFEGTDYLGCCSYRDEKAFCQEGGYFEDMKSQALEDLKRIIKQVQEKVCCLEVA